MRPAGLFALPLLLATAAESQQPNRGPVQQQIRDSVDARKRATSAQARFESLRRNNLPMRFSSAGGRCEVTIGRFCHWNSPEDTVIPPEPRNITRAREALLATLDSAAGKSPRDGWITGQRVRYLIEARNHAAAVRIARECAAEEWWCAALEGLALQQTWTGWAADSAFARALRKMPEADRCRWTDLTPLLAPELRRRSGPVGCGRNELLAERLWWLADPFWSTAGNDRRNEHYARHTITKILEAARNTYNLRWSSDMREMIVRYGWARYWTRGPGTSADPRGGSISGHEATPGYQFLPVSVSVDSVPRASFDLHRTTAVERYAPVLAKRMFDLDPQVALFRRGDSVLVVTAYDVRNRRELDSSAITASLVIARDERATRYEATGGERRSAMHVLIDPRPHVMSVEVFNSDKRGGGGRKRTVVMASPRTSAVSMSDPLLFEPVDEPERLPASTGIGEIAGFADALRTALGSAATSRGKVGVYWETYGLTRSDSAQPVALTLTRVDAGTLRRLGEAIGLAARSRPLTIRWQQMMSVSSVTSRSLVLDLSQIPRGTYVLRIQTGVGEAGVGAAETSKTIQIH